MSMGEGPYINEEGDIWVPVATGRMRDARKLAQSVAFEDHVAYMGREVVPLTDHEYGCDCNPSCYVPTEAWHFQERGSDHD